MSAKEQQVVQSPIEAVRVVDDAKAAFLTAMSDSLAKGTFLKLTLGKYRGTGVESRATLTRIMLKNLPHLKRVTRRGAQDLTDVASFEASVATVSELVGRNYLSATLFTTAGDVALIYSKKRIPRLSRGKPTLTSAPTEEHNRAKDYLVNPAASYLAALGVTHVTHRGGPPVVKPKMYAKYRQICRFVEIIDQLLAVSDLKTAPAPRIVDVGSGKGYLTFALHDHLTGRLGKTPTTTGIEVNARLVDTSNTIARSLEMAGLTFLAEKAENHATERLDVLIALHACDTATDDAVHLGLVSGAQMIITAPCCQHEIAPQLATTVARPMAGLMKFGLFRQRQADLITDAIRALLLETHGYQVRIIDFVSTEHTTKNIMIAAMRSNDVDRAAASSELAALLEATGIKRHRLLDLCGGRSPT